MVIVELEYLMAFDGPRLLQRVSPVLSQQWNPFVLLLPFREALLSVVRSCSNRPYPLRARVRLPLSRMRFWRWTRKETAL